MAGLDTETEKTEDWFQMGYFQKQELGTQWKHLELGTWGFIPGVWGAGT